MASPPADAPVLDRRLRRRQETIEEVLDIAVDIMGEQGVAGLSIGEIARRMGIRPPSLYVYFPSKHALYDALFERGARLVLEAMAPLRLRTPGPGESLEHVLVHVGSVFARWSVEHSAYSQLLFWRPVPGFVPSPQAYAPAVELIRQSVERFTALQANGLVRDDVDAEEIVRDWSVVISGVISQQLSNAPGEGFDEGTFTRRIPELAAMFARHYSPARQEGGSRSADEG